MDVYPNEQLFDATKVSYDTFDRLQNVRLNSFVRNVQHESDQQPEQTLNSAIPTETHVYFATAHCIILRFAFHSRLFGTTG